MRIFAYGIRDDEIQSINEWKEKNPDVEVEYTDVLLKEDTVKLAKGANSVVAYQQLDYTHDVFKELSKIGINNLSLRNAGVDNVDFDAAKKYNFKISNVPSYSPNAIAELSVIQITRLLRKTKQLDNRIKDHDLRWYPHIGKETNTQTIGIIGTGNIGKCAIQILKGFGAKIIAYDKYPTKELQQEKIYVDSVDELYKKADVISLYVPGVKENYHMINKETIKKMKNGVVIVNVSRGNLLNIDDVIDGLNSGKIGSLAIDVYEKEIGLFNKDWSSKKFPDEKIADLIKRDNVLVTPHVAFYTITAVDEMVKQSFDCALGFATGQKVKNEISF